MNNMYRYNQLVNQVEVRENTLYSQFALVLNEKKKKIRDLMVEIENLESKLNEGE